MSANDQSAELEWTAEGAPFSTRFGDPYFTREDGLAETAHVFLAGNGLPGRFRDGFRIAELGFGTGLNLLATRALWDKTGLPGRLSYTSFEAFPLTAPDMARALAAFPVLAPLAAELIALWAGGARAFAFGPVDVEVITGDARETLPAWQKRADAWYLDGFAPAKNPELWDPGLMAEVARHSAPEGTFATYTAAGHVRRALQAAGFQVDRAPGYGRKRHMTRGNLGGVA